MSSEYVLCVFTSFIDLDVVAQMNSYYFRLKSILESLNARTNRQRTLIEMILLFVL
jgi:hypothetical protein